MKKYIFYLLYLVCFSTITTAQNFNGIATYKTDRSMNMESNEDLGMDDALMKQLREQMKAQFRKEFTLTFTPTESLYKKVEKLETPTAAKSSGMTITISGGNDLIYRNTEENKYILETEIMGKEFLVEDHLETSDWSLEKESKNIGKYLCFKATKTRTITEKSFDTETNTYKDVEKERVTTAWYTPSIPIQHGPDDYYGLPGLILEISDGELTILCSKITLNPKDGIVIEKPSRGKKVNQEKFDEIQKKKNDEMMERYESSSRKKDGKSRIFQIKG